MKKNLFISFFLFIICVGFISCDNEENSENNIENETINCPVGVSVSAKLMEKPKTKLCLCACCLANLF